jgi:hypothetical protein
VKGISSNLFENMLAFLMLLVICVSCVNVYKQPSTPRFKYGTNVYIMDGFYKGCTGHVYDYRYLVHSYLYYIWATCPYGKDTRSQGLSEIDENILVEDLTDGP